MPFETGSVQMDAKGHIKQENEWIENNRKTQPRRVIMEIVENPKWVKIVGHNQEQLQEGFPDEKKEKKLQTTKKSIVKVRAFVKENRNWAFIEMEKVRWVWRKEK